MNIHPRTTPTAFYDYQVALEDLHQLEVLEWYQRVSKATAFFTKLVLNQPPLTALMILPTGPDDF